jgi:hypothetical protein
MPSRSGRPTRSSGRKQKPLSRSEWLLLYRQHVADRPVIPDDVATRPVDDDFLKLAKRMADWQVAESTLIARAPDPKDRDVLRRTIREGLLLAALKFDEVKARVQLIGLLEHRAGAQGDGSWVVSGAYADKLIDAFFIDRNQRLARDAMKRAPTSSMLKLAETVDLLERSRARPDAKRKRRPRNDARLRIERDTYLDWLHSGPWSPRLGSERIANTWMRMTREWTAFLQDPTPTHAERLRDAHPGALFAFVEWRLKSGREEPLGREAVKTILKRRLGPRIMEPAWGEAANSSR